MPSPFPGMDPYLEDATLWPNVHTSLVVALRDDLAPRVAPGYFVSVEERVYVAEHGQPQPVHYPDVGIGRAPSVFEVEPSDFTAREASTEAAVEGGAVNVFVPLLASVRERYLEIRRVGSDEVVTLIEVLSPANKRPGAGRVLYETKRARILASSTHLVEIDLLRTDPPMPVLPPPRGAHYRILVSRANLRPRAQLHAFTVRQPIPAFFVPLSEGDDEPEIRLGSLLNQVYDRGRFDLRIDYNKPPVPPLDGDDVQWARDLLARRETT